MSSRCAPSSIHILSFSRSSMCLDYIYPEYLPLYLDSMSYGLMWPSIEP